MIQSRKTATPGRGFVMFMIAVLILVLALLLIAKRYRQARPTPQMQRKGVALLLPASLGRILTT